MDGEGEGDISPLCDSIGKINAQGKYVVSDTHCPALHNCEFE